MLASVVVALCSFELYESLRRSGFHPATLLGLLGSVSLIGIAYNHGERAFPLVSALVVVFTFVWFLVRVVPARPVVNIGITLLGYSWIGVLGGFAGLLLAAPNGVGLMIGLVLCVVAYDVAGYFVGASMGHRPLAPDVSPNKTVEGLVGGTVASIVMGLVVSKVIGLHPWTDAGDGLLLGVVVAVFAPLGDLCGRWSSATSTSRTSVSCCPGTGERSIASTRSSSACPRSTTSRWRSTSSDAAPRDHPRVDGLRRHAGARSSAGAPERVRGGRARGRA